ncbi:Zinc finger, PMZ-type [Sesbania bispinosa]|nr:Zinc finger, PMZ-type [Sesbania bispinosa]
METNGMDGSREENGFEEEEADQYRIDNIADLNGVNFIGLTNEEVKLYHFLNRNVEFQFYNKFALKREFAARRWNVLKNKRGETTQQAFMCFKEGFRDKKYLEREDRKQEPRAMTRCGCFAFCCVRLNKESGRWKFKRCMLGDYEVGTFRRKWEGMVAEFGLEGNQWAQEMYEKRKMWATTHIRGHFFAGFRTTSRCEGLNSQIGRYVHVRNNLTEFLKQFNRYMAYTRQRELEADFESIIEDPVLVTPLEDLEGFAAKVYTRKCTCQRMESIGLPCEHIVALLHHLEITELPDSLVLQRWTKYAKQCVEGSNVEGHNRQTCPQRRHEENAGTTTEGTDDDDNTGMDTQPFLYGAD